MTKQKRYDKFNQQEFLEKCKKYVQEYKDGSFHIMESELPFKDSEKGNKLNEYFHKRCVYLIENN